MTPKENKLRAIRRQSPQWVPTNAEALVRIWPPIVERPEQPGFDAFGVRWAMEEGAEGGTYPAVGGHTVTDISKWRSQIHLPDVDSLDWSGVRDQVAAVDREQVILEGFTEMGLFERSYLLLGMEEALMAYMTATDEMEAMIAAIADYKIRLIERFCDEAPLDTMWYGDDWGTQNGLFIPPEIWRRVIKPHTRRIYDCLHRRGVMVNQHSCGCIEAVFGDMVEIGADMWNPCQPCNDLAMLKRNFGRRITFIGGIDSQFVLDRPGVTADEVRAEVRRRIDEMAAGGGYIASPSHSVPFDPELVEAMRDEIAAYGRRVYMK